MDGKGREHRRVEHARRCGAFFVHTYLLAPFVCIDLTASIKPFIEPVCARAAGSKASLKISTVCVHHTSRARLHHTRNDPCSTPLYLAVTRARVAPSQRRLLLLEPILRAEGAFHPSSHHVLERRHRQRRAGDDRLRRPPLPPRERSLDRARRRRRAGVGRRRARRGARRRRRQIVRGRARALRGRARRLPPAAPAAAAARRRRRGRAAASG